MPEWTTLKRMIWLLLLRGASAVIHTVTGDSPLGLHNAAAKAIKSITQRGVCTQSAVPTPSAPVDLVCNNGALKMVDDELPAAYKRVLGFQCDNNAMWQITGFKLRGSDTVRISFSVNAACNVFGCYQGADATDNYDLYVSVSSGAKYFRYGNGTYLSYWSPENLGKRFDVIYTPKGSRGMPQDSDWSPLTFTSANDLLIGATTLTGTSSKLKGNLYGSIVVDGRLKLIPCERVSDGVLGYYDTYGETFYEPYSGFYRAVSLGYDGSHYSLQTVGTAEVLTVSATGAETQTVTDIPMLLSVGAYADTVDIISGLLTHKIGIKVFDGTESFLAGDNGYITEAVQDQSGADYLPMCTHFLGTTLTPPKNSNAVRCYRTSGGTGRMYFAPNMTTYATTADFKAWLSSQYAAGTPVIVLYPLEEETTEQTTPHALHTVYGDNAVSWNYPGSTKTVEYAYQEPTNKVGTAKVGTAQAG